MERVEDFLVCYHLQHDPWVTSQDIHPRHIRQPRLHPTEPVIKSEYRS
jgi:hypothetical protein